AQELAQAPLPLSLAGLATRLGLPAGTNLDFEFHLDNPPVVQFGRAAPGEASLQLSSARLVLNVLPPDADASQVVVAIDDALSLRVDVEPTRGALPAVPTDIRLDRLEILEGGEVMTLDVQRLGGFLKDVVLPGIGHKLAGLPLSTAVFPLAAT